MSTSLRIISGILSFVIMFSPFGFAGDKSEGEGETGGVKQVTVAVDGSGDYATLEEARDYVRTLDKTKYNGIDVVIKAGDYHIDEAFLLTEEDGGTETCPIRYIGEDGAVISGGIKFTAGDFSPATGSAVQWFKEEAKESIVQIDLTKYGYSDTLMSDLYANPKEHNITTKVPTLFADGEKLSIARYPNDEYAQTGAGSYIEGGESTAIDLVTPMHINFDEKYADTVRSWHDVDKVFVDARFSYIWVNENSRIVSVDENEPTMSLLFTGGHEPREGTPFFWYNIPEELDMPGEYYIDEDSILYLYKTENFDECEIAIPKTDCAITVDGADYVTVENLTIELFFKQTLTVNADNFTLKDCTIRGTTGDAAYINGYNNLIDGNEFYSIGCEVLEVDGGDHGTLTPSNTLVTNNSIHDWGQVHEQYTYGLSISGVGITASHNELYNAPHIAVFFGGQLNVFEYGYVHDVMLHGDDLGVFASGSNFTAFGNTVRYSYIKNVGPTDPAFMVADYKSDYPACGASVFYWDFKGSGQQTYGNVIDHVYGCAYHSEGSFNTLTNSLIVGCAKYTFQVFDTSYREHLDYGRELDGVFNSKPAFITAAWEKAFPMLAELDWGGEEVARDPDKNYAGAPIGIVIKDNAVYYDKGYAWRSTAMKSPYEFQKYAAQMSELVDDGFEYVNSKRGGYDIDELVRENEELLGMTYEEFKTIGIRK